MKSGQQGPGVTWYLGTIQYCICLFVGGGAWFLVADLSGFFGGDFALQVAACLLLVALISAESVWAHVPTVKNNVGEFIFDFVSSAAIAAFGMAIVLAILLWLPHHAGG